jgi:hypothetical protein
MPKSKPNGSLRAEDVTPEDILKLFRDIDAETLFAILELRPRLAEVEEAALRLAGGADAVGRRQACGAVAKILDLVESEDDEAPAVGPRPI